MCCGSRHARNKGRLARRGGAPVDPEMSGAAARASAGSSRPRRTPLFSARRRTSSSPSSARAMTGSRTTCTATAPTAARQLHISLPRFPRTRTAGSWLVAGQQLHRDDPRAETDRHTDRLARTHAHRQRDSHTHRQTRTLSPVHCVGRGPLPAGIYTQRERDREKEFWWQQQRRRRSYHLYPL
jgi:hypothetical protein